ncbi:GM19331 [Drosophila sechellia]|uniref:GM19331 n=1 Tax=Drosophila sechellia TaxID=7238 RepID=B4IKU8_DROSE|nr:GM19331 [Drosophila sechellia]
MAEFDVQLRKRKEQMDQLEKSLRTHGGGATAAGGLNKELVDTQRLLDACVKQNTKEEMYLNFDIKDSKVEIQRPKESYRKIIYLKRKPAVEYKVGDIVAIRRTQFVAGKKLAGEYKGPYEVSRLKRNGRYDVRKATNFEGPSNTFTSCD